MSDYKSRLCRVEKINMQIKIFNLPIGADDSAIEEVNHFLRANKIIDVKRELAMIDGNSCWSFCITYMMQNRQGENYAVRGTNGRKIDYKEILEVDAFARFSALRRLRKQIAEEEGIPAYAVFTDAELAEIAKLSVLRIDAMKKIPGIGKKKIEKYGESFFQFENLLADETNGAFDGADNKS